MRRNNQSILLDNARRNPNVLGISAIVKEQIFAEVLLLALAPETFAARRGIQRHHPHARLKLRNTCAHLAHHSGEFMAKQRRQRQHLRVVSAAIGLQIGAAGKRGLHLNNNLAGLGPRHRNALDSHILLAVQHRGIHFSHFS